MDGILLEKPREQPEPRAAVPDGQSKRPRRRSRGGWLLLAFWTVLLAGGAAVGLRLQALGPPPGMRLELTLPLPAAPTNAVPATEPGAPAPELREAGAGPPPLAARTTTATPPGRTDPARPTAAAEAPEPAPTVTARLPRAADPASAMPVPAATVATRAASSPVAATAPMPAPEREPVAAAAGAAMAAAALATAADPAPMGGMAAAATASTGPASTDPAAAGPASPAQAAASPAADPAPPPAPAASAVAGVVARAETAAGPGSRATPPAAPAAATTAASIAGPAAAAAQAAGPAVPLLPAALPPSAGPAAAAPVTRVSAVVGPTLAPPRPRVERRPLTRPDLGLLEPSALGPLPRIAADGRHPWRVYAHPFVPAPGQPLVAVMVTGLGLSDAATEAAIASLPPQVTLAFSPIAPRLTQRIAAARQVGHEVLVGVPMEPRDFPLHDPGPQALLTALPPEENLRRLNWTLARAQGYVGVTNSIGPQRGDRFIATPDQMKPVLEALGRRGLLFIDARPAPAGQSPLPRPEGMPLRAADLLLDEMAGAAVLEAALANAEARARAQGSVLVVAGPFPSLITRLAGWTATVEQRGFVLAPASALAATALAQRP